MQLSRILKMFAGSLLAAILVCAGSTSIATAAPAGPAAIASVATVATASTDAPVAPAALQDPPPGPGYVIYGYYPSMGSCQAAGIAYLNGGTIHGYSCRVGNDGRWILYVIPAQCGPAQADAPKNLAPAC